MSCWMHEHSAFNSRSALNGSLVFSERILSELVKVDDVVALVKLNENHDFMRFERE